MDVRHINRRKSDLIVCVWGIHTDMEIPKTGKMRYTCHPELRRTEQGSELQREGMHLMGGLRRADVQQLAVCPTKQMGYSDEIYLC